MINQIKALIHDSREIQNNFKDNLDDIYIGDERYLCCLHLHMMPDDIHISVFEILEPEKAVSYSVQNDTYTTNDIDVEIAKILVMQLRLMLGVTTDE